MRNAVHVVLETGGAVVALCATLLLLLQGASVVLGARDSSKGYDSDLTLFSPEGRLYQVEYVMRAVGQYGSPSVGVGGEDCCVVACRKDLPDELVYPDSVSSIFRITDDIYSACTGMAGDVRHQVKRARLHTLEYKRQYGSPMPSRLLALAMADAAQVNTQHAAMRPMACVSFIISVDDSAGPLLLRVEPSGQVFQAWGIAAGRGSAASLEFLEETLNARTEKVASVRGKGDDTQKSADSTETEGSGEKRAGVGVGEGEHAGDGIPGGSSDSSGKPRGGGREDEAEEREARLAERRREGRRLGFGLVGEEDTVDLALRALSKASSGKNQPPLDDQNVEIAIASAYKGIRVCTRAEVKGFLGRMACSGK